VRRELWRKFSVLAPFAGLTSYHRSPIGPLRDDGQARAQLERLARETAAVGRAAGANLPAERAGEVMAFVDGLPAEMKSSMLVDLENGRPLELDWLTGAVVRLGKRHDVATPESQVIYDALKPYKNG
jgi:2-dehydropantoate 2-reductase